MEVVQPLPIEYAWKSSRGHRTGARSASLALALARRAWAAAAASSRRRDPAWSRRSARSAACRRPLTATVDVKLTGTVTFFNSALDQAWVQDATGGVRVDRIGLDPLVHVGDVVELTGRATMGGSAPIVLRETLRVVSPGHAAAAGQDHGRPTSPKAATNTCSSRRPASSAARRWIRAAAWR